METNDRYTEERSLLDVAIVGGGVSGVYSAWRKHAVLAKYIRSPQSFSIALLRARDGINTDKYLC